MKFWIETIDEAIALFNTDSLIKENDHIDTPKLTEEQEKFIRKSHKEIMKNYNIECWCWKPDDEGGLRYYIKNTELGLVRLFKDGIDTTYAEEK